MPHTINSWAAIEQNYRSSILLGNGASIAVHDGFMYRSLKARALELGTITDALANVFAFFGTEDFEFVLRILWHAQNVNAALGTHEIRTAKAYADVRRSLIETVRDIHPPAQDVGFPIEYISIFLKQFKHVFSLNYDLTTYWAMMAGQQRPDGHAFKDCFVHGQFDNDWRRFSKPIGRQHACTTVFYPHGNLALFKDRVEQEGKISSAPGQNLLDTILEKWEAGLYIPLFVSEGTSAQKARSIGSSNYLNTILRAILPTIEDSLVVYGWGFGEHDAHILKALSESNIERIAVSVYRQDQAYCDHVAAKIGHAFSGRVTLEFFDAESEGCWATP